MDKLRFNLKMTWRILLRNKPYVLINLTGLILGLTSAILIFLLIHYHLSIDSFHPNKDRIYRVVSMTNYETEDYSQGVPQPLGKAIRNDLSSTEKVAMLVKRHQQLITIPEGTTLRKFTEDAAFAEKEYFEIFHYPLQRGNLATALSGPGMAIITDSMAQKFFKGKDAIGRKIKINNKYEYTITGILRNPPSNAGYRQHIYLSYASLKITNPYLASDSSWRTIASSVQCYLLLKNGIQPGQVEKAFPPLIRKYDPQEAKFDHFYLQPLSDIHFNMKYDGVIDKKQLVALGIIGLFLVITACINFVNLATAQSLKRAKEVGIRKTLGSGRRQIFNQFFTETAVIVVLGTLLSIIIALFAIPYVNRMFDTLILPGQMNLLQPAAFILLLTIAVTFLAGYYPGILLARFNPVKTLKGSRPGGPSERLPLRKALVGIQLIIVQLMIIICLIVARQMDFSMRADIGFNPSAIVLLDIPSTTKDKIHLLRTKFSEIPGIDDLSFCYSPPMANANEYCQITFDHRPQEEPFQINSKTVDARYLQLFGLKLLAGQHLFPSDSLNGYLINETLARKLNAGPPENLIGRSLSIEGHSAPITGIIKDFHNLTFHYAIDPVCLYSNYKYYNLCAIKMRMDRASSTLAAAKKIWENEFPENIFSYTFMDESMADLYSAETNLLQLIGVFSAIAIIIACLGLFGLISFISTLKIKEIGIRKILGASISSILLLLAKDFVILLVAAFFIAAPLGWMAMHYWLREFAYHIPIKVGVFLLAILVTSIIVLLTVFYTSFKAALANPVDSLRTE